MALPGNSATRLASLHNAQNEHDIVGKWEVKGAQSYEREKTICLRILIVLNMESYKK